MKPALPSPPSSPEPPSGLFVLSLALSGAAFLGFEIYELLTWMIVKGRPVNIPLARQFLFAWIIIAALMALVFFALAWRRHRPAIRAALAALRERAGAPALALFAWLVVQSHILFVRPDSAQSIAMILFRTLQGLSALWFALSLTVWLYRRLAPRPHLAPMTHPLVNRVWAGLLPLIVFFLGIAFMRGIWDRIPHIIDETSYLFQAWMFAQGRPWLPAPPLGEFLEVEFIGQAGGKWFGYYPPGWSVVLAPFAALRLEWLANSLLGAVAIYWLVQLLKEERLDPWFWVAVPLLAMSPEVLMESGTFMNENLVLAGNILAVLMLLRTGERHGRRRRLLIAGAAAGVVFSTRYLDGLCLMVLLVALLAQTPGLTLAARARGAVLIGLSFAVFVALNLAYNRSITGQWFLTPFQFYTDSAYGADYTRLGFGPGVGKHLEASWAPGHSIIEAIYNAQLNFQTLNRTLWGWIGGSLLPVLVFLVFGRKTRRDWTYLGFVASYLAVYALWWFHGVGLGARYYYPLLFVWVIWTLKGARWLAEEGLPLVRERVASVAHASRVPSKNNAGGTPAPHQDWDPRQGRLVIVAFVLVNQVLALLFFWPVMGVWLYNFLGVTREVEESLVAKRTPPCVVFIDENVPGKPPIYQYYFLLNRPRPVGEAGAPPGLPQAGPVWFDTPVVFLLDRGAEENQKWREHIPDRPFYIYRQGCLDEIPRAE